MKNEILSWNNIHSSDGACSCTMWIEEQIIVIIERWWHFKKWNTMKTAEKIITCKWNGQRIVQQTLQFNIMTIYYTQVNIIDEQDAFIWAFHGWCVYSADRTTNRILIFSRGKWQNCRHRVKNDIGLYGKRLRYDQANGMIIQRIKHP